MTYSRPSGENPPVPLKRIRSSPGDSVAAERLGAIGAGRGKSRNSGLSGYATVDLFGQSVPPLSVMIARATEWKRTRSSDGYLLCMTNENAAGTIDDMCFDTGSDQPDDLLLQPLPIHVVIFVPDHQIHGQPLEAPVGVRLHELAHKFDIVGVGNLQQYDRQVTGDGVTPEAGLSATVANQDARGCAQRSVGVNHRAGEAARRVANRPRWR